MRFIDLVGTKVQSSIDQLELAGYRVWPRRNCAALEIQSSTGRPIMDVYYGNSRDFELSVVYLLAEARAYNQGVHKIVERKSPTLLNG